MIMSPSSLPRSYGRKVPPDQISKSFDLYQSFLPDIEFKTLHMPGPLLHLGATVLCAHSGQAQPTSPNTRVLVSGQPIVMQPAPYTIAGCPFNVSGSPVPCVTAQWITAATRILSNGMPVLLLDSQAICAPNGTPLMIVATQTRVIGT